MGDFITRADAIQHIQAYRDEFKEDFGIDSEDGDDASHYFGYIAGLNRATRIIERLPSAEPKGRWIKENRVLTSNPPQYVWHCSECGNPERGFSVHILTNHCPACGAKMEVTE